MTKRTHLITIEDLQKMKDSLSEMEFMLNMQKHTIDIAYEDLQAELNLTKRIKPKTKKTVVPARNLRTQQVEVVEFNDHALLQCDDVDIKLHHFAVGDLVCDLLDYMTSHLMYFRSWKTPLQQKVSRLK